MSVLQSEMLYILYDEEAQHFLSQFEKCNLK